jgi:hypothetical protein
MWVCSYTQFPDLLRYSLRNYTHTDLEHLIVDLQPLHQDTADPFKATDTFIYVIGSPSRRQ